MGLMTASARQHVELLEAKHKAIDPQPDANIPEPRQHVGRSACLLASSRKARLAALLGTEKVATIKVDTKDMEAKAKRVPAIGTRSAGFLDLDSFLLQNARPLQALAAESLASAAEILVEPLPAAEAASPSTDEALFSVSKAADRQQKRVRAAREQSEMAARLLKQKEEADATLLETQAAVTIQRAFGVALRARAQSPPARATTVASETLRKQLSDIELELIFEPLELASIINMEMLKKMSMPKVLFVRSLYKARAVGNAFRAVGNAFRARCAINAEKALDRSHTPCGERTDGAPASSFARTSTHTRDELMSLGLGARVLVVEAKPLEVERHANAIVLPEGSILSNDDVVLTPEFVDQLLVQLGAESASVRGALSLFDERVMSSMIDYEVDIPERVDAKVFAEKLAQALLPMIDPLSANACVVDAPVPFFTKPLVTTVVLPGGLYYAAVLSHPMPYPMPSCDTYLKARTITSFGHVELVTEDKTRSYSSNRLEQFAKTLLSLQGDGAQAAA